MSRVLILMYHIIDEPVSNKEARFCCTPTNFSKQMHYLAKSSYQPISLGHLIDSFEGRKPLPDNAVVVTFDDGFTSVLNNALPILQELHIPSTLFMVSNLIEKDNIWMHSRGYPRRDLLTSKQLRQLDQAGMTIGSHTCNHPRLPELSADEINNEIISSKQKLEDVLGKPVEHFAYPYGLFNETSRDTVEEAGYRSACSTRSGFNRQGVDRFLLRRIDIYGHDSLWNFKQKLNFGTNDVDWWFPMKYYAQRLSSKLSKTTH